MAALVCLAPAASASSELPVEKERWLRVETAHFTIFSNAPERKARSTGQQLEKFRGVLGVVSSALDLEPTVHTYIYLFKSQKSFGPYKAPDAQAYFLSAPDANFVGLNARPTADTKQRMRNAFVQYPYKAVYHEYVHYVLRNNFSANVPAWVQEGLAEYYGTFWAGGKTADIGRTHTGLAIAYNAFWIPLCELMSVLEHETTGDHPRGAQFYRQSWGLVHYLLHGNPERRNQFFDYINRVERGTPLHKAFQSSFKTTYEELDQELRVYLQRQRFDFGFLDISELNLDLSARATEMTPADVLYRLGDLLVHVHHDDADRALPYFNRALQLDGQHAGARGGLGFAAALREEHDSAVKHYRQAVKLDPENYRHHFMLGHSLYRQAGRAIRAAGGVSEEALALVREARQAFSRAISVNSRISLAYLMFGMTYLCEPEYVSGGEEALKKVWHMRPGLVEAPYYVVQLYLKKGDRSRAQSYAKDVIKVSPEAFGFIAAKAHLRHLAGMEDAPPCVENTQQILDMIEASAGKTPQQPASERDGPL